MLIVIACVLVAINGYILWTNAYSPWIPGAIIGKDPEEYSKMKIRQLDWLPCMEFVLVSISREEYDQLQKDNQRWMRTLVLLDDEQLDRLDDAVEVWRNK